MANTKDWKVLMTVTFDGFLIVQVLGWSIIKHIYPQFPNKPTNLQKILEKQKKTFIDSVVRVYVPPVNTETQSNTEYIDTVSSDFADECPKTKLNKSRYLKTFVKPNG